MRDPDATPEIDAPAGAFRSAVRMLDKATGVLDRWVLFAVTTFLGALFIALFTQVALRYVFDIPLRWLPELAGFIQAYLIMWGCSCLIRNDGHIRITFIPNLLPAPLRRALSIGMHAVLLIYIIYLTFYGYRFALLGSGETTPTGTFDFFIPRLALVTGGFLMAVQLSNALLREIFIRPKSPPTDQLALNR